MSFLEDFQEIVEKEGYYCINIFLDDWVKNKQRGWLHLHVWLEKKHGYYCVYQCVACNCKWVYGNIQKNQFVKNYNKTKKQIFPNKNGFKEPQAEEKWMAYAKKLGYKDVFDMFKKWPGTDQELCEKLGVSRSTVSIRRKLSRNRRSKFGSKWVRTK